MVEEGITVTVRDKNAVEWIRNKVQSGAFTSEADAVEYGIAVIREEDFDLEEWMRTVVADRYRRHQEHPETAIPLEQVVSNLEARRTRRAQGSR